MIKYKKVKALWFCSWYPSDFHPSLGDFVQRQAIATSKYSNIIVVGFFSKEGITEFEINVIDQNADLKEIIIYYPKRKGNILSYFLNFYDRYRAYKKAISSIPKNWSANIVHAHVIFPIGIFAYLYARMRGLPFLISEHSSLYSSLILKPNLLMKSLIKFVSSKAKLIITVSKRLTNDMQQLGITGSFITIPNVLDTTLFTQKSKELKQKNEIFKWIHTSTLVEGIKNIEGILEAIVLLARKRNDFQVQFIGGRQALINLYIEMAITMNINDFVSFEPEKEQKKMIEDLKNTDAYVSFSNSETFGLAILEALYVGLPCVVSDTGEVTEWIDDKSGRIVEVGDIHDLVNKMEYLMDHIDEFDTSSIQNRVNTYYSYDIVGQKIDDVYWSILEIKE
jgi:glycosyltransferase involved in cell wall biosynthesis